MMATKMWDDTDGALVSTFLSSGLDLAKEELWSSWWTRARRYRNSIGRLGMGHPREGEPDLRVASGAFWRARWQQGKRTCDRRLVPLGGHGDSRASGLARGVWCLLESTVTAGQAECDRRASGHLLDAQQVRPLLIWHEHPGAGSIQRRGGDKSWRDVVEAEVGRLMMKLAQCRRFIYPREALGSTDT